jgi:hypothetical protein
VQWQSGGLDWEVLGSNLGNVTFCFSVSLSKTLLPYLLLSTQEYKWAPVITGKTAMDEHLIQGSNAPSLLMLQKAGEFPTLMSH